MFSKRTAAALAWLMVTIPLSLAAYGDKITYGTQGQVTRVRRERNLDHWDSDTLAYYLDEEYPGHDVAIMFYASWDTHSHSLAPYWDRIATLLDAGNSQSRLVMALFDCELNLPHQQLCQAVGITHYPTLMFIGSGPYHDTDPLSKLFFGKKAAGAMGEAPVPKTVKFQGNWQYYDSIMDWIRTMQALSNWHTWTTKGLGRRLRNFFLPHKTPNVPLPVGVPGGKAAAAAGKAMTGGLDAGTASSSTNSDSALIQAMEDKYIALTEQLEKVAFRSSKMMDNIFFSNTDMFAMLDEDKCWEKESNSPLQEVLRNCVGEMSLDYCQRVGTQVATEMIDELEKQGMTTDEMLAMTDLEQTVLERIAKEEPYCSILDTCILEDFKDEKCRPKTCPFKNENGCKYLASCLDPELQLEYATALGLTLDGAGAAASATSGTATPDVQPPDATTSTTTPDVQLPDATTSTTTTDVQPPDAEPKVEAPKEKRRWGM